MDAGLLGETCVCLLGSMLRRQRLSRERWAEGGPRGYWYAQAERGELVDGDKAFQELRRRHEQRRKRG
jgi:hypothetical protein